MPRAVWTLAKLDPEQERLLKEGEAVLGAGVLLAYAPSSATPSPLTASQLECLRGLEEKLGVVLVAVEPHARH
jgi:hypothetical protein